MITHRRGDQGPEPQPLVTADGRRVYTVAEINEAIRATLALGFPGTVWVRGEVQRLPDDAARRQHVYFELHGVGAGAEAGYQIPVALLGWDRERFRLGRYLDGSDPEFRLANKLEVCLECVVDFYPPYGRLSLKVVGVDTTFTLGQLEAKRRAVLAFLQQAGLLERNRAVPLPLVPLRIGLVTSVGSAAERDFISGLIASGYGFRVSRADCRMMGDGMQPQIMAALGGLAAGGCEVIVIARGGGSRADLSWFDQQELARAIAVCRVPVITAIGHEIDTSIADLVAHTQCKTPTAAAQLLVERVAASETRLLASAARIGSLAARPLGAGGEVLRTVARRLERAVAARQRAGMARAGALSTRLAGAVERRLAGAGRGLARQEQRLGPGLRECLARARSGLALAGLRIQPGRALAAWPRRRLELGRSEQRCGRLAVLRVTRADVRLTQLADQVRMLDPRRLLARGYTLTHDETGRLVRRVGDLQPGDRVWTRFIDGRAESAVAAILPDEESERS